MKYDKLVRDKIPSIITDKIIKTKIITDKKVIEKYSLDKISEELYEFQNNPTIEEAADLIEATYKYIQTVLDIESNKLESLIETESIDKLESLIKIERIIKHKQKGSFEKNIILLEVED